AAVQGADHAFRGQHAARTAQLARPDADLVDAEFTIKPFAAAQERRTDREEQGHIAARVIGPMAQQEPGQLFNFADCRIRYQVDARPLGSAGHAHARLDGQARTQGLDIQDGAGDVPLKGNGAATQLQALPVSLYRPTPCPQCAHARQLALYHRDAHLAHEARVDPIAGQIEARAQIDL